MTKMTTKQMNDLMRQVNEANERGDREAAIEANEKLTRAMGFEPWRGEETS